MSLSEKSRKLIYGAAALLTAGFGLESSIATAGERMPDDRFNWIEGRVCVADGDGVCFGESRLEGGNCVGGREVRFYGIDAFETPQTCRDAHGRPWACGKAGTAALADMIGGRADGAKIRCKWLRKGYYGRPLVTCYAAKNGRRVNLNRAMVDAGFAIPTGSLYKDTRDKARAAKRGAWAGSFVTPRTWRKHNPGAAGPGCKPGKP